MPAARPQIDSIALARRNWEAHGWNEAAPGMEALTAVMRSAQLMRQRADEVLKPFAISFPRYELLAMLMFSRTGALPMTKASVRLHLPAASVTHQVSQLEKAGLVRRQPDPNDGRGTLVSITDQGIALVGAATPVLNRYFCQLGLEPGELSQLVSLLNKIRQSHGDVVEEAKKQQP